MIILILVIIGITMFVIKHKKVKSSEIIHEQKDMKSNRQSVLSVARTGEEVIGKINKNMSVRGTKMSDSGEANNVSEVSDDCSRFHGSTHAEGL